jgi:hypothetical protein
MRLKLLKNKRKINDIYSGDSKLAMSEPVLQLINEIKLIDYHVVNKETEMRPDIISLDYYGTEDGLEIILKYNGISNPYSLKEGMILAIPERGSAKARYKRPSTITNNPKAQFTDKKRLSQKDKKRQDFLKAKSESKKNGSSENLPPNMLKNDEKSKIVQNERILLGANMKTKKK